MEHVEADGARAVVVLQDACGVVRQHLSASVGHLLPPMHQPSWAASPQQCAQHLHLVQPTIHGTMWHPGSFMVHDSAGCESSTDTPRLLCAVMKRADLHLLSECDKMFCQTTAHTCGLCARGGVPNVKPPQHASLAYGVCTYAGEHADMSSKSMSVPLLKCHQSSQANPS